MLSAQYSLGVELKGVIYLHRITDIRFTKGAVKTLDIFKKICGDMALKNVLLVTSRWSEVAEDLGSKRERELRDNFWTYMLHKGSMLGRYTGDRPSAVTLVSQLLSKDSIVLDLQRDLVDEGKDLNETPAGQYVDGTLERKKKEYEKALTDLDELRRELLEEDRAMKRRIQNDWDQERALLRKTEQEQEDLRRPVGSEVQGKIKKKSGFYKVLPWIPTVLNLLAPFVGIPFGAFDVLSLWLDGTGCEPGTVLEI